MIDERLITKHTRAIVQKAKREERYKAKRATQSEKREQRRVRATQLEFRWHIRLCYWRARHSYRSGGAAESVLYGHYYLIRDYDHARFMIALAQTVLPVGWQLSLAEEYLDQTKLMPWHYRIHVYAPALCGVN